MKFHSSICLALRHIYDHIAAAFRKPKLESLRFLKIDIVLRFHTLFSASCVAKA